MSYRKIFLYWSESDLLASYPLALKAKTKQSFALLVWHVWAPLSCVKIHFAQDKLVFGFVVLGDCTFVCKLECRPSISTTFWRWIGKRLPRCTLEKPTCFYTLPSVKPLKIYLISDKILFPKRLKLIPFKAAGVKFSRLDIRLYRLFWTSTVRIQDMRR